MYADLGPRTIAAKPDATGTNPGAWTAVFTQKKLGVTVAEFEIYRCVVQTTQAGTAVKLCLGSNQFPFSIGPTGKGAEWDPNQAQLVRNGQTVVAFFSQKETVGPAPKITIWLRCDPALVTSA